MRWGRLSAVLVVAAACAAKGPLVFQSDFGTRDGAVSVMHGVALGIDPSLVVQDLSHENAPYDVWEAGYRLAQAAPWWARGTVFVSVVDPGVGTERRPIALRTASGQVFVGPDNGTFTLVAERFGISELRVIDLDRLRRTGRKISATFQGRDVFAVVGAGLASGRMSLASLGPVARDLAVRLPHTLPVLESGIAKGGVPTLDFRYGNVWSDIPDSLVRALPAKLGDTLHVVILRDGVRQWSGLVPYVKTFGDVPVGSPLVYENSLGYASLALNLGDFAKSFGIASGSAWELRLSREGHEAGQDSRK